MTTTVTVGELLDNISRDTDQLLRRVDERLQRLDAALAPSIGSKWRAAQERIAREKAAGQP